MTNAERFPLTHSAARDSPKTNLSAAFLSYCYRTGWSKTTLLTSEDATCLRREFSACSQSLDILFVVCAIRKTLYVHLKVFCWPTSPDAYLGAVCACTPRYNTIVRGLHRHVQCSACLAEPFLPTAQEVQGLEPRGGAKL